MGVPSPSPIHAHRDVQNPVPLAKDDPPGQGYFYVFSLNDYRICFRVSMSVASCRFAKAEHLLQEVIRYEIHAPRSSK